MKCAGEVIRLVQNINTYRVLVGETEGERLACYIAVDRGMLQK
jgi:hypothetical protein